MKGSKFTEEQIVGILREQGWEDQGSIRWIDRPTNGAKTAELCRRHGISSATFYACKAKVGGMEGAPFPPLVQGQWRATRSGCWRSRCSTKLR